MVAISKFAELLNQLENLMESKENPDEWYVVKGRPVGEYSIFSAEKPDDYDESEEQLPSEDRDANVNVDGYYQIGSQGWADIAFDDDIEFVSEVGFSRSYDKIDRRINGYLLVHESQLSDEALQAAEQASEVSA